MIKENISVIVPFYNEEGAINSLYAKIKQNMYF
jgi:hypothetical protein